MDGKTKSAYVEVVLGEELVGLREFGENIGLEMLGACVTDGAHPSLLSNQFVFKRPSVYLIVIYIAAV